MRVGFFPLSMVSSSLIRNAGTVGLMLALLLMIFGAKLLVIDRYGSDLPEWDQWDAEGLHTLLPWKQGKLTAGDLYRAHNEHRIVLTKILGLAGVAINGQWDSRLQCVINALLHGVLAVAFFAAGRRALPTGWHIPWFIFLFAMFGLPLAWQNVIAGFHSQQYFLLGFSILTLWLLPFERPFTRRWWLGISAAALAYFSMGSGFLAASAVLVVLSLDLVYGHRRWEHLWPTFVACLLITAVGWFGRVTVDYHEPLKAKSVGDFLTYTINNLKWPMRGSGAFALLLWMPWIAVTLRYLLRANRGTDQTPMRLAAVGGWVLLQILASAYARGAGGGEPASRYMDTLALGMVVNGFALAWLCSRFPLPFLASWTRSTLAAAWILVSAYGLDQLTRANFANELKNWVGPYHDEAEWRTRAYLATGRSSFLDSNQIPYPGAGAFIERLAHPELRALLPVSVRQPLALAELANAGFKTTDFSSLGAPLEDTGLAAETPRPRHGVIRSTFGSKGSGRWESRPIVSRDHDWLVFRIAGSFDAGIHVRLVDAASGLPVGEVSPTASPVADSWKDYLVASPDRPFRIVVEDSSAEGWIAFAEPVEMAALSRVAAAVTARGAWFLYGGAALAALCTGIVWLGRTRKNPALTPA